jgi:hypothetical protein
MVVDSNETEDEDFVTDIGTFDNNAPTVTPSVTQQTPTRTFRDPMPQFEARVSAILQDDIPSLAPFVAPSNTTSMDYMGDIYESISHHAYQNAPIGSDLDTEPIEQQDHAYTPDSPKYKDDYEDSKPKAIGTNHLKSAPRPPTNPEPFTIPRKQFSRTARNDTSNTGNINLPTLYKGKYIIFAKMLCMLWHVFSAQRTNSREDLGIPLSTTVRLSVNVIRIFTHTVNK